MCVWKTSSNTQRKKWKFYTGDTTCACGRAEETMAHMLQCFHLAHPCSLDDHITFNNVGKQCVGGIVRWHDDDDETTYDYDLFCYMYNFLIQKYVDCYNNTFIKRHICDGGKFISMFKHRISEYIFSTVHFMYKLYYGIHVIFYIFLFNI